MTDMVILLRYEVGVNLLYPKIGEIRSVCNRADGSEFKRELLFVTPFRIKYGIGKWGRHDCVTAHGLRTYCARTVSSSPRRRSPSVPVRMIRPDIRVVVGGTSTVSGSRRIIPNTLMSQSAFSSHCNITEAHRRLEHQTRRIRKDAVSSPSYS